jgi:lysozyme
MRIKHKLAEQLIRHEGMRLRAYLCPSGFATVGVGRNLEARGFARAEAIAVEIDRDTALVWLGEDIAAARVDVDRILARFDIPLGSIDEPRLDVLANMAFNMGAESLSKFRLMFGALKRKDYPAAADQILASKYAKQVGNRSVELALQMDTGQYQSMEG